MRWIGGAMQSLMLDSCAALRSAPRKNLKEQKIRDGRRRRHFRTSSLQSGQRQSGSRLPMDWIVVRHCDARMDGRPTQLIVTDAWVDRHRLLWHRLAA
jgi:hypothetical protein